MKTLHMKERMKIRHIDDQLIDFVSYFGDSKTPDKKVLTPKEINKFLKKIHSLTKRLQEAERKGGVTLVEVGDKKITTYYNKH